MLHQACFGAKTAGSILEATSKNQGSQGGGQQHCILPCSCHGRLRKNSIRSIEVDGVQVTNHQVKVQALTDYFKSIIGTTGDSVWHVDCQSLYQQLPRATDALTNEFTEQEAIVAIKSMNRCSGGSRCHEPST